MTFSILRHTYWHLAWILGTEGPRPDSTGGNKYRKGSLCVFICLWCVYLMCDYWVDSQKRFIQVLHMEYLDNYIGLSENAEN
jgi:hypothetical protein